MRKRVEERLSVSPHDLGRKAQIDDAIAFWEPFVGRPISSVEAGEIIDNMTKFFKILLEWDSADRARRLKRTGRTARFKAKA